VLDNCGLGLSQSRGSRGCASAWPQLQRGRYEDQTELAAKRLMFKPLNYNLPENAHFLQDYKLPCPLVVLVRCKDGKDEKW